jgi:HSP20 family protein
MAESKTLEHRRETPMNLTGVSWPTWPTWPSRRWIDEFFRDSAWHQMIKIEECTEGDSMVVRAELPGIDPDRDVRVEVVDDMLVISAERTERHEEHEGHTHRSEFRYGSMTRSVAIPKGVDESKIVATYKDGVLEIKMPVPTATKDNGAHRIAVQRN